MVGIDEIISIIKTIIGVFYFVLKASIEFIGYLPEILAFTYNGIIFFIVNSPIIIGLAEVWILSSAMSESTLSKSMGVVIEKNAQMIKGIYWFIIKLYNLLINIIVSIAQSIQSLPIF